MYCALSLEFMNCYRISTLQLYNVYTVGVFVLYLDTHEEHLLVFFTVHNLVGIGAVVSILCQF